MLGAARTTCSLATEGQNHFAENSGWGSEALNGGTSHVRVGVQYLSEDLTFDRELPARANL